MIQAPIERYGVNPYCSKKILSCSPKAVYPNKKWLGNPGVRDNNRNMPLKTKRIHLLERNDKNTNITKVSDQVWESGGWSLLEAKAKSLLGGSILFHKKRSEPSFFGGLILNYRIQDKGQKKGLVIFTFEYRADHRNILADRGGWSHEMKVVLKK